MNVRYSITCVCGQNVNVNADNDAQATERMLPAMDQHVASKEHPSVPKNLTHEQKVGMIHATMKKG